MPGGIRCRILDVPAAGAYLVKAVDAQNYETFAQVYDSAGLRVCGSPQCDFAAPGRYTMVLNGSETNERHRQRLPVRRRPAAAAPSGCAAVSDTGYQEAPHRGEFAAAGQYDCLQLPSPAGARVVELLPGDATGAGRPEVTVVDATGAYVCDSSTRCARPPAS